MVKDTPVAIGLAAAVQGTAKGDWLHTYYVLVSYPGQNVSFQMGKLSAKKDKLET